MCGIVSTFVPSKPNNMNFRVGQKVVCVRTDNGAESLSKNKVYTILGVSDTANCRCRMPVIDIGCKHDTDGGICRHCFGPGSPLGSPVWFMASRFRPVVDLTSSLAIEGLCGVVDERPELVDAPAHV